MTPKQQKDYELISGLTDITIEEFQTLNLSIESWYYNDDRYVLRLVQNARNDKYRNDHLEAFDCKSWKAGNCYYKGCESWRRQDGTLITESDEKVIKAIRKGQGNSFTGNAGDMFIKLDWSCDSSG